MTARMALAVAILFLFCVNNQLERRVGLQHNKPSSAAADSSHQLPEISLSHPDGDIPQDNKVRELRSSQDSTDLIATCSTCTDGDKQLYREMLVASPGLNWKSSESVR